ncbi:MFS DHA1 protein [Favolaschia claudopus]|uniref:MFS DHA1 protein n=1 Tax=Favolaschia claudopus TaxID=2862362 RepID=A0AAW0C5H2_9AGAR
MSDSPQQRKVDFGFLPIPPWCRVQPGVDATGSIGYAKVLAFAFASTFSAWYALIVAGNACKLTSAGMNLYYVQPILVDLTREFNVNELEVSRIPTLLQAGYAVGLFLLSPLGDILRRRQLVLTLISVSGALTIGLALTHSLVAFEVLSFFTAVVSVTPQVLIPLTADLAPANRRATFIAIVLSGLLTGVLLARVLSGIIAQYTTYRDIYWMGCGGQFALAIVLYLITPDVPVKNADLSYFQIMKTMAKFAVTEPALVQGCLIFFCSAALFAGFWVTLTFLLDGSPYHYSTLVIGLFGLLGIAGIAMSPIIGRLVDGFVPWTASLVAISLVLASQIIQTFGGPINVGAIVVAAILLDLGAQATQVSLTTTIFGLAPEARARLNTLLVLSIFLGQVMGTAVGTKLYVEGGYKLSSGIRVVFAGIELLALLLRGPNVSRYTWVGWEGGFDLRRKREPEPSVAVIETAETRTSTQEAEPEKDVEKDTE